MEIAGKCRDENVFFAFIFYSPQQISSSNTIDPPGKKFCKSSLNWTQTQTLKHQTLREAEVGLNLKPSPLTEPPWKNG